MGYEPKVKEQTTATPIDKKTRVFVSFHRIQLSSFHARSMGVGDTTVQWR